MNIGAMFRRNPNRGSGTGGSSTNPDQRERKKSRREADELCSSYDKEYARVSQRKVLPTKWACSEFLSHQGLQTDFDLLLHNAGMTVFGVLNCDTYKRATHEFLASFYDDLALRGRDCTVSFRLNGIPHTITFEDFCGCFGFSTEGELDITEEALQEASQAWEQISVYRDRRFLRKKTSRIQNPTIRYFTTFWVNSLFGKGDTGAMAAPEICVIYSALHPEMVNRVNLGALLIQHFRRQRSANSGDICCGGLVTQIAYRRNFVMPPGNVIPGSKYLDDNHWLAQNLLV